MIRCANYKLGQIYDDFKFNGQLHLVFICYTVPIFLPKIKVLSYVQTGGWRLNYLSPWRPDNLSEKGADNFRHNRRVNYLLETVNYIAKSAATPLSIRIDETLELA